MSRDQAVRIFVLEARSLLNPFMQHLRRSLLYTPAKLLFCLAGILNFCAVVPAQSTSMDFPTPVLTNEVSGVISARDLGDPRLTKHYYALTGMPGDLVIFIESNNLNGDVDVFTARTLRPLTKLPMYAGINSTATTKSIYLRKREPLILRVEARSANDDNGSYRIRFSGGFEPLAASDVAAEETEPTVSSSRGSNTRRVNSAGARVNEAPPEVASAQPIDSPREARIEDEPATKTQPEPETTTPTFEPAPAAPATPPRTTRRRSTRRTRRPPATTARTTPTPQPEPTPAPEPVLGPRLIIETKDGMRVERYMSQVRRMSVERGVLVVITNDGKVERRAMNDVLRVTIEP
jgi:hypothetical protein